MCHGALRLLFSNLASNSSGSLEKSVNFQNPQTLAVARTAGCCEWALAQKSANAFLLLLFRRTESLLKSARKRLEILLRGRSYPPSKEAAQRLTGANKGYFCAEVLWDDTTSRRKRMCAFTACVRFLRRRGPARLRCSFVHLPNRQNLLQSLLYYGTISSTN